MEKEQKTFEELTIQVKKCLKEKLHRANGTLKHYDSLWRKLKRHMKAQSIDCINSAVCKNFLLEKYNDCDYWTLSKTEKDTVRAITTLIEFIETGTIHRGREATDFEGPIGQLMIKYVVFKTSQRLAQHTIDEYEQHLSRFLRFLKQNNVTFIGSVNQLHVLSYIKTINTETMALAHIALRVLRSFFKYLHNQRVLDVDFSCMLPKDNYKSQTTMPSVYTKNEIEKLIASVDTSNVSGKRNYAVILLAARLGLRAFDIANIKFENILWERNTINLTQYKTGNKIELPLLSEVGNAIIDYLKNGRPKSNETYVFLCARSPFNPVSSSVISQIVRHLFTKTDINTKHRKHGPHALRHSLAGRLLEIQTTLPVISEVLGHENIESTKYYLRIDLTSLRQCMLDVPTVSPGFYSQKGGFFYV